MTVYQNMTIEQFALWAWDTAHPGDFVLFEYADPGFFGWAIARCQRRMIRDLYPQLSKDDVRRAAAVIHAGMITNDCKLVEMTRPQCRRVLWCDKLKVGDKIIVRRPVIPLRGRVELDVSRDLGGEVAVRALLDVGKQYPTLEIVRYWLWSYGFKKLTQGKKFKKIFENPETDVCSDSCWRWSMDVGIWPDIGLNDQEGHPAGHYPAELTLNHRLRTVVGVRIIAG